MTDAPDISPIPKPASYQGRNLALSLRDEQKIAS
jgi:hypothetical protein